MPTRIIKNRIPELKAKMSNSIRGLTRALANEVVTEAKMRAPVRTGALRNSIKAKGVNQYRTDVEVGVDYGIFVEWGSRNAAAQPFLIPAFEAVRADLVRNPSKYIKMPR